MADKQTDQLNTLTESTIATTDSVLVYDVSADETKTITKADFDQSIGKWWTTYLLLQTTLTALKSSIPGFRYHHRYNTYNNALTLLIRLLHVQLQTHSQTRLLTHHSTL